MSEEFIEITNPDLLARVEFRQKELEREKQKEYDDKRFAVAKDLFVMYRGLQSDTDEDDARFAIRGADIFMAKYLGKDKAVSLPSEKIR